MAPVLHIVARRFTTNEWFKVFVKAQSLGIEPFENGLYTVWIHPDYVKDLLGSAPRDLLEDGKDSKYGLAFAGGQLVQTSLIDSIFVFGKNSDPSSFQYFYPGGAE